MKYFGALCVLAVVCSAFGAPEFENHDLLVGSSRDMELLEHTSHLVEVLVGNLRKSAQEALDAVGTFNAGIKQEANQAREKIIKDIQKFRDRVTEAVDNVMHRISNTSVAVKECVNSHKGAAAAVFNETLGSTLACVDDHIAEVSGHIRKLVTIAIDATATGSQALTDMKKCTANNTNLLSVGSCLKAVVMQIEMKSGSFLIQSALTVGRINLAIATLPASLEVCAGLRLIQTGIAIGKVIVDIGSCSASGIFNTVVGKPQVE